MNIKYTKKLFQSKGLIQIKNAFKTVIKSNGRKDRYYTVEMCSQ